MNYILPLAPKDIILEFYGRHEKYHTHLINDIYRFKNADKNLILWYRIQRNFHLPNRFIIFAWYSCVIISASIWISENTLHRKLYSPSTILCLNVRASNTSWNSLPGCSISCGRWWRSRSFSSFILSESPFSPQGNNLRSLMTITDSSSFAQISDTIKFK